MALGRLPSRRVRPRPRPRLQAWLRSEPRFLSQDLIDRFVCVQELWRYDKPSRTWTSEGEIGGQGGIASLDASGVDDEDSDEFWVT